MSHEKITTTNNAEDLFSQRLSKLNELRHVGEAYPNHFRRTNLAIDLYNQYEQINAEQLQQKNISVRLAGRIMLKRDMGKSLFLDIQDMSGKIQIYVKQNNIGLEDFEIVKRLDLGDIVGIKGILFRTKTNQLSIKAEKVYLLTKSLRPLPDKFHGLSESDKEQRYRQRYLDSHYQRKNSKNISDSFSAYQRNPSVFKPTEFCGSRNADDACHTRRCFSQTFYHAS